MAPILEVNNLEVVYNKVILVLKGLSLKVDAGSIVALLGSNGAGKSTTLKSISGLLSLEDGEITDGSIRYHGEAITGLAPHQIVRRGIFQVMEGRRIFEDLSVEENLICGAYIRKDRGAVVQDLDKCFSYFPVLKTRLKQTAGYLSGGEQQMLAVSRALLARPSLMMLDEPSLGLAPLLVDEIFEIVQRINRNEGAAILLVEQNALMALERSSYGYIMENGRVVLDGPVDLLLGDRGRTGVLLGSKARCDREKLPGREALQAEETMVELSQKTLTQIFVERVAERGDRVALREKDLGIWQRVTWNQYLEHVKNFALGLVHLGFKRGDHLAILGENCREWLYADLASLSLGGITLGVYPTSPAPEVLYVVKHSDSVFVVCNDQEQTDKILKVIDDLPLLKKIIVKDMKGLRNYPKDKIMSFQEVEALGKEVDRENSTLFMEEVWKGKAEDVCAMIYTSGTTGPPKGDNDQSPQRRSLNSGHE